MTMAGVEITDTHLRALLPGATPRTTTRRLSAPADLPAQLRAALAALTNTKITAVGIATTDPATGDLLSNTAGVPVHLVRPAQALAAAESRHGAARGAHQPAAVLIDSTLTAAVLPTTATRTGARIGVTADPSRVSAVGSAWGHTVVELSGRRCVCGARGCLAAYASAPAILSRHREMSGALIPEATEPGAAESQAAHPDTADAQTDSAQIDDAQTPDREVSAVEHGAEGARWAALAELVASAERSAPARWVLAQTAGYLGAGIANLVNLVEPDCVVIGGWAGLLLGSDLLPKIRTAVAAHTPELPGSSTRTAIRLSRLGPNSIALGAALLAADHFPDPALTSGRPLATALGH